MKYPDNWDFLKKKVKERDNYTCQKCFSIFRKNSPFLDVHHIIPLSKNGTNALSNLISLCKICHKTFHPHMQKRKKTNVWKKYLRNTYSQ